MLKRFLKRWPLFGLLILALSVAGGCATDEVASNATYVLEELSKSSAPTGAIELGEETLVYSADLPGLASKVSSLGEESDKIIAIKKYLILQERIDCILKNVEESATNDTTVRCQGRVLVDKTSEHGLLTVTQMLDAVNARDGAAAKREYLTEYLLNWDEIQQVNHVTESLAQMKRTKAIPMFGSLVRAIHNFPVMYEGEELVPKKDVNTLLDQFRTRDTEDAQRALVAEYLER